MTLEMPFNETLPELEPLQIQRISQFFSCLADETRINILRTLSTGQKSVNEIRNVIGLSLPAISYQLRILLMYDLVRYERQGRNKVFYIADTHVMHILRDGFIHISNSGICYDQNDYENSDAK
jgi:DNA-binding transcriptional ArsR family regulator